MNTQLNIFEKEGDPLWGEIRTLESKQDSLRKGIFLRYSALLKMVESLQSELIEVRQELNSFRDKDSVVEIFKEDKVFSS